jgi:Proto-chlorophyllide reductase 57 kD subunit
MSTIRSSLKGYGGEESITGSQTESAHMHVPSHVGTPDAPGAVGTAGVTGESKCPFTGMIEAQVENQAASDGPAWTPEAEARMAQIPSFIRPMVQKGIEDHARTNKCPVIDDKVIDSVRNSMGM